MLSGVSEGQWEKIKLERQVRPRACHAKEKYGHSSLGCENPPGGFGAEKRKDESINVLDRLE